MSCTSSTRDCDADPSNGCEVSLSSPSSCGTSCTDRTACSTKNGVASCSNGACGITCSDGYGDCDGLASTGCEVDFNQAASCGTSCKSLVACQGSASCDDGVCAPPSCAGGGSGRSDCGSGFTPESCCASSVVPEGLYYRSYDGVSNGYTSKAYPAVVSSFRLDKYEVTVGRFRAFKQSWDGGWRPTSGSGKHTHLNQGQGLSALGGNGYESGWESAWDSLVEPSDASLRCDSTFQVWTAQPGVNERRPMTCANWYEMYAFCIWDGGFLPSEAEWNYVAAGGAEQRVYPWSEPATSTSIGCGNASYGCLSNTCGDGVNGCTWADLIDVGTKLSGTGRWGHSDLGGNVWEWALDWHAVSYPAAECVDCTNLSSGTNRVIRGGSFTSAPGLVLTAYRNYAVPEKSSYQVGARCARVP